MRKLGRPSRMLATTIVHLSGRQLLVRIRALAPANTLFTAELSMSIFFATRIIHVGGGSRTESHFRIIG